MNKERDKKYKEFKIIKLASDKEMGYQKPNTFKPYCRPFGEHYDYLYKDEVDTND